MPLQEQDSDLLEGQFALAREILLPRAIMFNN